MSELFDCEWMDEQRHVWINEYERAGVDFSESGFKRAICRFVGVWVCGRLEVS